jgi:hypothetical protein
VTPIQPVLTKEETFSPVPLLLIGSGQQRPPVIFAWAEEYRGEGRSQGLSRGLLVLAGEENVIREGMGIGCPAVLSNGEPVFSRTCYLKKREKDQIECTFLLDTALKWGITGRPSRLLTGLVNRTVDLYMRHPALQPLLPLGSGFRSLFLIRPFWFDVSPVAEVQYRYRVKEGSAEMDCRIHGFGRNLPVIYLLNEVGADAFAATWCGGKTLAPPRGWEPCLIPTERWFYDPSRDLHFRVVMKEVSEGMSMHLFWGREKTRDLCWAGYGIQLVPERPLVTATCSYTVTFERSRGP